VPSPLSKNCCRFAARSRSSGRAALDGGSRTARHALLCCLVFLGVAPASSASESPSRIISLNPSLTAILLELGAREALVGIDDYSARQQPTLSGLPRVGGLFNPSLEAVVGLRPDLVVLVPSVEQRDFRQRLEALGIRVVAFDNIRFGQVLANIRELGVLVGKPEAAESRVRAIERMRAAVATATQSLGAPRTVVVLQREPTFIVGRGSFIDEMLGVVGADNLGASFDAPYPRVSVEWMVGAAPEVLIDMSPDTQAPAEYWSRWPSLPAHLNGRVLHLDPAQITLPGPNLDRSLELLAVALHGEAVARALAGSAKEPVGEAASGATAPSRAVATGEAP